MATENDFWVFGYGSLMWRPGFDYLDARPALLRGYHRAFCIYSFHYRGTRETPGLVLGLDRGGSCRGMAFRVRLEDEDAVRAYLDERELDSYAYVARSMPVEVDCGIVTAYTYVADTDHEHYAGDLGLDRSAAMIMDAAGTAGLNRDYLINTIRELEREGYVDAALHTLLERVSRLTGEIEAGGGI